MNLHHLTSAKSKQISHISHQVAFYQSELKPNDVGENYSYATSEEVNRWLIKEYKYLAELALEWLVSMETLSIRLSHFLSVRRPVVFH